MRTKKLGVYILVLITTSSGALWAGNLAEEEMQQRFELMQPAKCNKPKSKAPTLPRSSFYDRTDSSTNKGWRERFFSDIDGDGTCEIIDIWIDRLTPLPNDNRLNKFSVIYQALKGRWVERYGFEYVPTHQLRDKTTGRIYYLFDFDFDSGTGLMIHAHGTKYFDRWPTRQEEKRGLLSPSYGIQNCSYDKYVCDGFDLGKVAEILLNSRVPSLSPAEKGK